jgi:hypothetical protein
MGFDIGAALTSLGQSAPGIGKSFDDARRQREQDELERQKTMEALASLAQEGEVNKQALADKKYTAERTKKTDTETDTKKAAAKSAYQSWHDTQTQIEQAQSVGGDTGMQEGGYAGPLRPEYKDKLGALAKKTPVQQMDEFDFPMHAASDEGIKNTYNAAVTDEDKKDALAAAAAKAEEDRLSREDIAKETNQTREDIAKQSAADRANNRDITLGQKNDQRTADRLSKMSKDLDPSAMVRGAFSISKQVMDRADRLRTLDDAITAYQNGNADSRQIEELAIGMNSLLSGSNTGAQEQVKMLVPKTAIGNASKMYEFLSGNPQGTNQKAFVDRMMQTVEREKQTAQNQINKTRFSRIAQYKDVEEKDPIGFNDVLRSWEINPDEYHAWKTAGYKQPDVAKMPGMAGAGGSVQEFATEAEAEAAGLKPGTRIKIAGRSATWQ